ncbi:hypothetical protein FB446DRAFT_735895 [Lentinula raphanica]|nr:hypothetical protein FB446DRAFT_735895 [Lentinula raphanica]
MRLSAAYLTIVIFRLFPTASSVPVLGVSIPILLYSDAFNHSLPPVDNQAADGQTFSIPTYSNFRKPGQETSPNEQAGNTVTVRSDQ